MKWSLLFAVLLLIMQAGAAFAECVLDDLVGYTLIASKYIAGRIDNNVRKDDFQGCDFDRIIVFDDNTGVRCVSYSYTYYYHPKVYNFF
jgi:hypothetical protein